MAIKKDPSETTQAADAPALKTGDGSAAAPEQNPAIGGSYTRDPHTGELTLVQAATAPAPPMRKVQDPVTGAITRIKE